MNIFFSNRVLLPLSVILGVAVGYLNLSFFNTTAQVASDIFINLLKLVSLPIIFLSIVSTASGMENMQEVKNLGKRVAKYTIFTTLIAASIALILFVIVDPVGAPLVPVEMAIQTPQGSYFSYLLNVIPSNFVQPFIENNVISVLFLAMLLSLAILALPDENRTVLNTFFKSLYAAVMKITAWIIKLMPIGIWAFTTLFIKDLQHGMEAQNLLWYLFVVVAANIVQATITLPILLKLKGIPPLKTFKAMLPALSVAFFSKSSSAALPMAMKCAEEEMGVSRKVAGFSLPLCTTINMNACAGFILTTVLFVSMSNGVTFTGLEMFTWIFVSTIAAIGNAGVPMGCYFLASAFLAAMNVPLNILAVILPFYSMIDMLETAINVWSDSCVTAMVQQDVNNEEEASLTVEVQPVT
ncbi:MAG: dicarboxylate/amino acid:cation symporter [Chlamydiota bacterium]|nr:dicarboxylate/amino acid:cation symporter [Chlamydiota bacterium]